ncbi:MAG: 50S ribosomal protein L22 [Clostridia bacterium]|jgi:large subunit ribosomal protein L22|nr:50S ribosomal protein L22 [Clostridia bacterium]
MAKGHRSQIKRERNAVKDLRPRASVKNVPVSETKAKVVAEAIKGKSVIDAMGILRFSTKKAAGLFEKVLASAVANAEHNLSMNPENLYVAEVVVCQGSKKGRYRVKPEPQGRVTRRLKPQCHINIVLNER